MIGTRGFGLGSRRDLADGASEDCFSAVFAVAVPCACARVDLIQFTMNATSTLFPMSWPEAVGLQRHIGSITRWKRSAALAKNALLHTLVIVLTGLISVSFETLAP